MSTAVMIPFLGALSAFLFVISFVPSKSALTQTLEKLQNAATGGHHTPVKMLAFLDEDRGGALRRKLIEAGWYTVTPSQFVLRVAACLIGAAILAFVAGRIVHWDALTVGVLRLVIFVLVAYAPVFRLNQAAQERKNQVQRTLPDFLDMIASTVQAGLSLNAALVYAVDAAPGALGEEIKEALSETRLGRARSDALKAAARRLNQPEFTTTITAITQAEQLGANIASVLSELADDTRTHRILIVEDHAAKLPVKMVFPMAFFLLPSLFVVIFGTLVANYIATHR